MHAPKQTTDIYYVTAILTGNVRVDMYVDNNTASTKKRNNANYYGSFVTCGWIPTECIVQLATSNH